MDLIESISNGVVEYFHNHGTNIPLSLIKGIVSFIASSSFVTVLYKAISQLSRVRKQRLLLKDLHPYFSKTEINKVTKYFIETKCQNIPPSREQEPKQTHAFVTKQRLIPFFVDNVFKNDSEDQRFYIILADSGMGKTTFMINLYLKYVGKLFGKRYDILLYPLGSQFVDQELDKYDDIKKKNTILLLDAFDEDLAAVKDYRRRMDDIIHKVWKFRKVIITCRTQFFPFEEEEPGEIKIKKSGSEGGFHNFLKMYVSPFDDKDISKYLRKKYPIFQIGKRRKAKKIVMASPDLMVRPMLLSYIDDLICEDDKFEYGFQIYERLIKRWIDREANRKESSYREEFKNELKKFSEEIAIKIYENFREKSELHINGSEIEQFARKHKIQLDTIEMKSRSLLNRDSYGHFKFSHKSILEYFIAQHAFKNLAFNIRANFNGMSLAVRFYKDLCFKNYTIPHLKKNRDKITLFSIIDDLNRDTADIENFNRGMALLIGRIKISSFSNDVLKIVAGFYNVQSLELDGLNIEDKDLNNINFKVHTNLKSISSERNKFKSITPFLSLRGLQRLNLSNNRISDLSNIDLLFNLKELNLSNNEISFCENLVRLRNLEVLDLSGNEILNISPIAELKTLKYLNIKDNENINLDSILNLVYALPGCEIEADGGFDWILRESRRYPNDEFKLIEKIKNQLNEDVISYEVIKGGNLFFNCFNTVRVYVIEANKKKNVVFSSKLLSNGLVDRIRMLVNIIYSKYGEDDLGNKGFKELDLKQIKDKIWPGRMWMSSGFKYPISFNFTEENGIEMGVYGVECD